MAATENNLKGRNLIISIYRKVIKYIQKGNDMNPLNKEFVSALQRLIGDSSKKRFTIVGDIPADLENILLIAPLLKLGNFENVFLEGLNEGEYNSRDTSMKNNAVYNSNPRKYDLIISRALSAGVKVYGINNSSDFSGQGVRNRARYIMGKTSPKRRSLVITGIANINYWYNKTTPSNELPLHLIAEGLQETEILGVTALRNLNMPYLREPALEKVDEIEDVRFLDFRTDKIADYLLLYPAKYLKF